MYGIKIGTPEKFLSLRNRLAHGGGLNNKAYNRLINIWKQKFKIVLRNFHGFMMLVYVELNLVNL